MAGILFLISAPSGSGKSTLVEELRHLVADLEFSVSYTTRRPRGSEQHGREYCFISRDKFERMIAEGAFLEHAEVFGNLYGTARHFLADAEAAGKDLLLDIDVQGAGQLRLKVPESVSIFVLPPDRKTLEQRLRQRSEAEHVGEEQIILRRLEKAREEIGNYPDYRYILVNGKLDQAVEELSAIVWWERLKRQSRDAQAIAGEQAERFRRLAESCLQGRNDRVRPVLESFQLFDLPTATRG